MSVLSVVGKLLGIGGGSGPSAVETVAKVVDEYKYTEEEQAENEIKEFASARAYEPSHMPSEAPIQQEGLIQFFLEFVLRLINKLVDAAIHLVRPWITIQLLGGVFGYWKLPEVENVNPLYFKMVDVVMVFWFGARVITKDLPAMMQAWAKLKNK